MQIGDVARLQKELRRLERQHENLARRYNRAFIGGRPDEAAIQQELEACGLLILAQEEELRRLSQGEGNAVADGLAGRGRRVFTWTLHRRG